MTDTRWCPQCGAEYIAGITVCADDGAQLVDSEPVPVSAPSTVPPAVDPNDEIDAVEFDLTEWPEETRRDVEWMLRGAGITFEWIEDGVLGVPGAQAEEVDGFLDYLAAGASEEASTTGDEWRVTGPDTGAGSTDLSIDDFYEGDPAREDSEESTFGDEWVDDEGVQCEVDWVHDTGELYLMKAPKLMPFMVEILDIIPTREEVERVLHGWEEAMSQANSAQWLRDRVATRAATPPESQDPEADAESETPLLDALEQARGWDTPDRSDA